MIEDDDLDVRQGVRWHRECDRSEQVCGVVRIQLSRAGSQGDVCLTVRPCIVNGNEDGSGRRRDRVVDATARGKASRLNADARTARSAGAVACLERPDDTLRRVARLGHACIARIRHDRRRGAAAILAETWVATRVTANAGRPVSDFGIRDTTGHGTGVDSARIGIVDCRRRPLAGLIGGTNFCTIAWIIVGTGRTGRRCSPCRAHGVVADFETVAIVAIRANARLCGLMSDARGPKARIVSAGIPIIDWWWRYWSQRAGVTAERDIALAAIDVDARNLADAVRLSVCNVERAVLGLHERAGCREKRRYCWAAVAAIADGAVTCDSLNEAVHSRVTNRVIGEICDKEAWNGLRIGGLICVKDTASHAGIDCLSARVCVDAGNRDGTVCVTERVIRPTPKHIGKSGTVREWSPRSTSTRRGIDLHPQKDVVASISDVDIGERLRIS